MNKILNALLLSSVLLCASNIVSMKRALELDVSLGTLLINAAKVGNLEEVQYLISMGVDVNCEDDSEMSAICEAAKNGHLEVVNELIAAGANINFPNRHIWHKPLLEAAYNGHSDIVRALIRAHVDTNQVQDFEDILDGIEANAIEVAAYKGYIDLVEELLQSGIERSNEFLIYAAAGGQLELIRYFLNSQKYQCDINAQLYGYGETALIMAASARHLDIVNELLDFGADIFLEPESGCTALIVAIDNGYLEIVKAMLDKLDIDTQRSLINTLGVFEDMDAGDEVEDGKTPLMIAGCNGNAEMVKELLKRGADITLKNHVGKTALNRTKYLDLKKLINFHSEIACLKEKLLGNREWIHESDDLFAEIIEAIKAGNYCIVKFLKEFKIHNLSQLVSMLEACKTSYDHLNKTYKLVGCDTILDEEAKNNMLANYKEIEDFLVNLINTYLAFLNATEVPQLPVEIINKIINLEDKLNK